MKFKNEIIVICLICFILISISSVYAEDNNTNIITGNDNVYDDKLSLDERNEILNDNGGNFEDLNSIVNGGSSTVELNQSYSYTSSFNDGRGILISRDNITIDGKGHAIDAKGQSRIFNVTGTTVTLKNIIFINGFSDSDGGAIYGYGENLRVLNCTFINNTASGWGGSVYSYPDSYSVFYSSRFINNSAKYGGALATIHGYRQDVLNCIFDSNNAVWGGGLLMYGQLKTTEKPWDDTVNIRGCLFENNGASNGSAICNYLSAYINMTNSIILGEETNLIDSWGAMFFADYNWWGNTYDNRSTKPKIDTNVQFSKWLYLDVILASTDSNLTVSINNLYDGDAASAGTYSTNGLPSINVNLNATNATVMSNNVSLGNAGMCKVQYLLGERASITAAYKDITVTKSFNYGSFKELQDLIRNARNNTVITLERDYVYSIGDTITQGIVVSNKYNITIDGRGHTVNAAGNSRVFGVSITSKEIVIKNIKIVNGNCNSSKEGDYGAGMIWESPNGRLINCTFINNYANGLQGGGALFWSGSNGYLIDCAFINNTHEHSVGGAVYWYGTGAHIVHTVFENNTAKSVEGSGGALYLIHGGANIMDCNFTNNRARYGGAINDYGYDNVASHITNCIFKGNVATTTDSDLGGGAICANDVSITNSIFVENQAKNGAAVYCLYDMGNIDECLFINNTATLNGIVFWGSGGNITNSIFLNNNVNYGGCILINIFGGMDAEHNWFGNVWKNHDIEPNVDNRANMTKWLFLNATEPVYDEVSGRFITKFSFLEYDATTNTIRSYDSGKLPHFSLKLSSQNLTLGKNIVELGEEIEATTTYFMGNLVAEYESVRYVLPFKFQKKSWIEANQSVIKNIGKSSYLSYTIRPFHEDLTPFLRDYLTFETSDKSIVRVDSQGKITTVKAGTANITIKYSGKNLKGDYEYLPSNITITVNVIRTETYIEMIYEVDSLDVGEYGTFIATVRPSTASGGLTYSCNDTEVLKVESYGYYKALKPGIVNVTVSYPGDANNEPSQLSFIVKVNRKPTSIDDIGTDFVNLDLNSQYRFYTYLNPTGAGELKCISNDTSVATAEFENGVFSISGVGLGLAKVTVYFEGNDEYEPCSVDVVVNVTGTETKISVNETLVLHLNDIGYIPYTVSPYNIFDLVFTSNDTSVIRFLDNYGQYETVGNGVANVTIDLIAHGKYLPSSANVIVTVKSIETSILVNSTFDLYVGQTRNMGAKLNPKVGDLTYESNDTSVVNVTQSGYLKAMGEGVAKITVTFVGGNGFLPSKATAIVTVKKGSTRIEVDDEVEIYNKRYGYLNAKLISEWQNAQISGLEYSCNDTDTLTINGNGFMMAKKLGEVEITINYAGSDKYLPTSKKILVKVVLAPTEIIAPSEILLLMDESDNINATLDPNIGQLNYLSNDTSVVTVDDYGNISAVGIGKASIFITYGGNERYAPANKTVIVEIAGSKVPTAIIANETINVYVGNSTDISATINPISALLNGKLIYEAENPEIIEIDEEGNIRGLKVGNTTVTITYNENNRFLSNITTVKVNVLINPSEINSTDSITLNFSESANIGAELISPVGGQLIYTSSNLEIVTVDENGVITAKNVGNATITVSYAGNENYTASSKTVEVKVTAVPTAIIVADNIEVNLTESYRINAKLTPYSKGKLTYASTNASIVTVDEKGLVTAVGAGEADIIVSFAGEGKYLPNSTAVHVKVTTVATSIDIITDFEVNRTETLNIGGVVVPYDAGKLTYESTNSTIVSVSDWGLITAHEFGEADIIVRFAGKGKYLPSTATVHIRVVGVKMAILVDEYIEVDAGTSGMIQASLVPEINGKLTFKSNDSSIVSVTENGRYNVVKMGMANITISYAGEGKYLPVTTSMMIRGCGLNATINVNDKISANPFDNIKLNASLTPVGGKLNYESNDTEIVTVDENGTLTVHKRGLAAVTVSFAGDGIYLPAKAIVEINSTRLQPQITFLDSEVIEINGTRAVIQVGLGGTLNFELNYRELRNNLSYLSNNSEVVSIENGFLQAISGGIAEVTVSYAGNERYVPFSEKLTVTVTKRISQIKVDNNITLSVEGSVSLDAKLVDQYGFDMGGNLEYSVDNTNVITLDNGKITALKKGTAVITIRFNETVAFTGATAKVNVTVIAKATKITLSRDNIYLDVFENSTVTAALDDPEDGKITFKSSDETVATVDGSGKITAVGHGVAVITASYAGCDDYLASSANVTVRVTALQTIINVVGFTPIIKGDTIDLNATLTPNVGNLVYSSGDSSIVYVDDETGKVTGLKTGTTFVNVEFKGNKQYSRSIKQVTVQVILDSTSISVKDHQSLEVGHRISINATLNPSEAGYLVYSSNDERIAAIDSNGIIQGRSEGMTIITVRFEGNQQYLACERSVTVYVNKDSSSVKFDVNVEEDSKDTKFSINLPSDADGTFTVFVDGKEYQTKTLVGGKATIEVDGLAPGDHKITLKYSGDDKYSATVQDKTIHIAEVRFDKNADVSAMYTTSARYTVQLKIDTQVFAGKTVTFKVNGNAYYVKTDKLGYASIDLKLPAGEYSITAEYKGVEVRNKITFNHIIVAKNIKIKKSAGSKKIKITLNKVNNKILAGKKVTLKFNGKKYKAKTNKKGIAKFTIKNNAYSKLKVGKNYKYTVTYAKDKVTKKIKIKK